MSGYGHMMDGYGGGYGHMGSYSGFGGFGGLESLGGLILLAIVVVAVIFLINYLNTNRPSMAAANASTGYSNNAISILNEKFARGEITEEEYKSKKTAILGN